MSQVVHTSHTTPPAHPHAPPPDATSYHTSSFDAPNTLRFSSDKDKEKSVAQTRALMEHQTPCQSTVAPVQGQGQGEEKGRKGSVISHNRRPSPVGNRSTGSPLSAQHGMWEASHRLTGHHSHARRGPTVPSRGTNIRCTTRTVGLDRTHTCSEP